LGFIRFAKLHICVSTLDSKSKSKIKCCSAPRSSSAAGPRHVMCLEDLAHVLLLLVGRGVGSERVKGDGSSDPDLANSDDTAFSRLVDSSGK
jgi:hypothetical protein